ncbi:hypothetical protein [Anoxybacillus sp. TBDG-1]
MEIRMSLDRINFRIEDVHVDDFQRFSDSLDIVEKMGFLNVRRDFGKGHSEYKYNFHIGQGDGAVYVAYHHNSENAKLVKERFHVKVEYNPSKHDRNDFKQFWLCMSDFSMFRKSIKSVDIAFDIPVPISNVVVVSTTGKAMNKYQTTMYFGQRSSNGFLRIYDKAKEEGKKDEVKTRIEFTLAFPPETTFQLLQSVSSYDVFEQYIVSVVQYDKLDAELACVLYAINSGFRSLKDFTRRKQEKIKNALLGTERIDFQRVFDEQKTHFFQDIKNAMRLQL